MVLVDISVIKVYINKMTKEELKNFVLSNPRKCNYKFIQSNFPEIYNEIISLDCPDDFTFSQKLYHYMNDDLNYQLGICRCGNRCKFKRITTGYYHHCSSSCSTSDNQVQSKMISTCKKRFGVDNCSQSEIIKEQIKNTKLQLYGDVNYNNRSKAKQTCIEKFGSEHYMKSDMAKEHIKQINLDKFGVDNYMKTKEGKEKVSKTCLQKYGHTRYNGSEQYYKNIDSILEKIKETCQQRYGNDYYAGSEEYYKHLNEYLNKYKQTCISKYNNQTYVGSKEYYKHLNEYLNNYKQTCQEKFNSDYYFGSEQHLQYLSEHINDLLVQTSKTCKEKYGVDFYFKSDDFKKKSLLTILNNCDVDLTDDEILTLHYKNINQKGFETKKKNGTLNTSRIEDELTEYFIQCDINFKSQYKSDLYPFACDFYLTDYDLYIEIQGTWTHGGHPFDETNKDDIDKLNMWKSKDNGYYKNAINTWSIRDVKKRKIAKENNLNYLEIYSTNLSECINVINTYINEHFNNE